MVDRAVPVLPSRDLTATRDFYGTFGFSAAYEASDYLILRRGDLQLEFFPHPDLVPWGSDHMCSIRVADLDALWNAIRAAGVVVTNTGFPRLHAPRVESWGGRVGFLVDIDGTQLNLVEEPGRS